MGGLWVPRGSGRFREGSFSPSQTFIPSLLPLLIRGWVSVCLSPVIYYAVKAKVTHISKCCGGFHTCQLCVLYGADTLSRQRAPCGEAAVINAAAFTWLLPPCCHTELMSQGAPKMCMKQRGTEGRERLCASRWQEDEQSTQGEVSSPKKQ